MSSRFLLLLAHHVHIVALWLLAQRRLAEYFDWKPVTLRCQLQADPLCLGAFGLSNEEFGTAETRLLGVQHDMHALEAELDLRGRVQIRQDGRRVAA